MPKENRYTVQRVADGTCRTIKGYSVRSAMTNFFVYFPGAECGERFRIKEYNTGPSWEATFQYNGGGRFRKIPD